MEITLFCRQCENNADGHWHNKVDILVPKCPICKSSDVYTSTDESLGFESLNGDDYDE